MDRWVDNLPPIEWDAALAGFGGHPLQSALWGNARRMVDNIVDLRLAHYSNDNSIDGLARVETRKLPILGKIAWVPRGPTFINKEGYSEAVKQLLAHLASEGYWVYIDDRYSRVEPVSADKKPHTIWLDLSQGKDRLWANLDQQWRYGVRAAARAGVIVEQGTADDVTYFYRLCRDISSNKGFQLPGSESLMRKLLDTTVNGYVSAHLFLARYKGMIGSGALILRCGRSIHYFWGASDRAFSKQRTGEALQWGIIEWALRQGIERYDLEGIDPQNNPGVAAFKKKMGGEVVVLSGKAVYPLNSMGKILVFVGNKLSRS